MLKLFDSGPFFPVKGTNFHHARNKYDEFGI